MSLRMVLKSLTLKSILIILNSLNVSSAILYNIITLFTTSDKSDDMLMNYISMLASALCCAAAVMESPTILMITANLFLSKVVVTTVLWVYRVTNFIPVYSIYTMILHGAISSVAYYLEQKLKLERLNNLISKYTGLAAIPLDPPAHIRGDVI